MAKSPKCPNCDWQTYKVAGKPQFLCPKCKGVFSRDVFTDKDFEWKDVDAKRPV